MEEYERILTAQQLAESTLSLCFYVMDSQVYINYNKILGIYQTIHLILTTPLLPEHEGHPYRHLTQQDINAIYSSYKAIAEQQYKVTVNSSGKIIAMPDDPSIPLGLFGIIAEITSLLRKE